MKFDIFSFTRAFPCREYQMLVRFASIRRLTVVEWIIMNAANQAKTNQTLANSTIEKIFSTVYRISKCESLVRTSVYELRSRKLIEIEDFDEFSVSSLKFGDIRITELGEKAICNNYIPSESQTRDESVYHNLSFDLFKSNIKENEDASVRIEFADPSISDEFPRTQMLSLLNTGKLLDSKYAAQQYLVEDLDLLERSELSELITFNVSIDDGEIVCNYYDYPIVQKLVKEMLTKSLVNPQEYFVYDESTIATRNIALGDEAFDLLSAYADDVNNDAIFSNLDVYKEYKRHFKRLPDGKVWFVFDDSKKTFEVSIQPKGRSLTIYIPKAIENHATVLGGTNGQHIIARKYKLPFGSEEVDCVFTSKEKCEQSCYTQIVEDIIAELSLKEPAILSLYALPVLGGEIYPHLSKRWTSETTLSSKIADFAEIHKGITNLQLSNIHKVDILRSLISDYSVDSFDEAKEIAEKLAKDFDLTKEQKGELGLCLLSNGQFEKSYSAIDQFLTGLVGSIAINDESFTAFDEYGNALYAPCILEELFSTLASPDVTFPSPWSKYEAAFIRFLLSMDRIRNALSGFDWNEENDKAALFSAVFEAENPKAVITEILTLSSLVNDINGFNEFKLENCSKLSSVMVNANILFDIASHLANRNDDEIREIYVLDTCALLNHPDILDYFSNSETIIIPAIVESELGAQKKKNPTAQVVIRSIEKHRLANEQFGYERCRIESAHMDLISEHDFFKKQNDPRVISVARYYIAFNPTIITDDVDMRNLASSLKIEAIGSNAFLENHGVAVEVQEDKVIPTQSTASATQIETNPLDELLDAPIYKFAKKFSITAEEISLMASNKIRTYGEFVETSDDVLRSIFGKKQFLSKHLLESKKKVRKEMENLQPKIDAVEIVEDGTSEVGTVDTVPTDEVGTTTHTIEAIDDSALKNGAPAGYMKDVLIINVFNHHFSVTEKLQDKKIFRDFLSLGVGIGEIFKDVDEARSFAEAVQSEGQYRNIVEVDYADFLKDQGFDLWVVTLKKFRDRFSVFLSFKNEELSRAEILERAKFGKHFKRHSLAVAYATNIVKQFNDVFDNDESSVIEETIVEVDTTTDIIYDHDNEPLYLCKNDNKQLLWRDDELQYQFIDAIQYRAELQKLLDSRYKGEYTFTEGGMKAAFEIAMETALPGLHSEIYRAEQLLALLGMDAEINECDIEFYTSYIQTLSECIDIQKQYRLPEDFKLSVIVYDEFGTIKPVENYRTTIPAGGASLDYNGERTLLYDVEVYGDYESFFAAINTDPRQLVFVTYGSEIKESSFIEIQTAIFEKAQQTVFTGKEMKDIAKFFKHYVRLAVTIEGMVEDEWIADYSVVVDDDSVYETDEEAVADEKTVVVNSQPETIVELVAEEKELPPIVWNENNTLYIYKGQPKCAENGHEVIQVTATMIGFDNREIKINVSYCRNCDRFFISYTTYELYRNRYGIMLGNLVLEGGKYQGEFNDVVLAEASPLKLCGYTVNQSDGYTAEQRRYIIATIISRGIMSKGEVIRYLEYFININGRRTGNELALSKWKDDLAFTLQYDSKNQNEVYINRVRTPY